MSKNLRHFHFLALALTACFGTAWNVAAQTPLRIGVVHVNSPTGSGFLEGVRAAAQGRSEVSIGSFAYANEQQGIERLTEVVAAADGAQVDVVVGPTESGIFIAAHKQRAELEAHHVVVISPLVTAEIPHQEGGWLFRTNVNASRRSQAIYDLLNKYMVRSMALLYADTQFGRLAEAAFRRELTPVQRDNYAPLSFKSPPVDVRQQLRQVLNNRPEAVGIVSEREDLATVYDTLVQMNSWGSRYRPILFTIIDARDTPGLPEDFYFVTVTPDLEGFDDVRALAFDTTRLVLDVWSELPDDLTGDGRRQRFRDDLEATMRSYTAVDSLTGLVLSGYENLTNPRVFRKAKNGYEQVDDLQQVVGLPQKLWMKCNLVVRRFGWLPVFNVLLVSLIVGMTTFADIKSWYSGNPDLVSLVQLFRNWPFAVLLLLNWITAMALYVYMAEAGNVRYDSVVAAIAIAVTPLAILRAKLFETKTGRAVGLGKLYDQLLQWINERMMLKKHREVSKQINLLAYHNTVDGMRSYLRELYQESSSVDHRVRLENELEERLSKVKTYAEKRKVLARMLFRTVPWNDLREHNMAPCAADEMHLLHDPEILIRKAARHAVQAEGGADKIEDKIREALKGFSEERRAKLEAASQDDLEAVVGTQARLRRRLAYLCVLCGYDEGFIAKLCDLDILTPDRLKIHLLAYHNSVDAMDAYLFHAAQVSASDDERQRILADLGKVRERINAKVAQGDDALSYLERRMPYARLLNRRVPWQRLWDDRMAPSERPGQLKDPVAVIRNAANRGALHKDGVDVVKKHIDEALSVMGPDRRDDMGKVLERDLEGVPDHCERLRRRLAFLSIIRGTYDQAFFENLFPEKKESWLAKLLAKKTVQPAGDGGEKAGET